MVRMVQNILQMKLPVAPIWHAKAAQLQFITDSDDVQIQV